MKEEVSTLNSSGSPVQPEQGDERYKNKTSLIVNYLPKHFSQDDMKNFFSSVGDIDNCTLMADKTEGFSLGYGFVNYVKPEDAQSAIDRLNGLKLDNKVIKVSFARPSSDAIKGTNVYVSGLPSNFHESKLLELFQTYGWIIDHKLLQSKIQGSGDDVVRNAALVRYDQRTEALKAIEELNGKIPPGLTNPLVVRFAYTPKTKAQKRGLGDFMAIDHRPGKMMIPMNKGFSSFSPMGVNKPIPPLGMPPPPPGMMQQPASPHMPWHEFSNPSSLHLNTHSSHPSKLQIPRSNNFQVFPPPVTPPSPIPRMNGKPEESWSVFIYNLGTKSDEKDLWQMFGPFGAISSVRIIKDKGFGFVNMLNRNEAEMAIQSLHGSFLNDRLLQVSFKTGKNGN